MRSLCSGPTQDMLDVTWKDMTWCTCTGSAWWKGAWPARRSFFSTLRHIDPPGSMVKETCDHYNSSLACNKVCMWPVCVTSWDDKMASSPEVPSSSEAALCSPALERKLLRGVVHRVVLTGGALVSASLNFTKRVLVACSPIGRTPAPKQPSWAGPCGGKTTASARIKAFFENLGWKVTGGGGGEGRSCLTTSINADSLLQLPSQCFKIAPHTLHHPYCVPACLW